jgi:hypothetical protein
MRIASLSILALACLFCAPTQAQTDVSRLIAECDRLAAGTFDDEQPRSVPGVPTSALDARSTMIACLAALKVAPTEVARRRGAALRKLQGLLHYSVDYFGLT